MSRVVAHDFGKTCCVPLEAGGHHAGQTIPSLFPVDITAEGRSSNHPHVTIRLRTDRRSSQDNHRIARWPGKQKAVWAVAQSIIVMIYHILSTKQSYQDLGEDSFHRREAPRLERHHVRQLEQLGYTVTFSPQVA